MNAPKLDATVVIPTYNRRDTLLRTLTILARVEYPADRWEAVVVDDGSSDGTSSAVEEWIKQNQAPIRCLYQTNAGPATARNRGAESARGRVLIFLDNDIEVRPDFLRLHLETLAAHPGCWILGRTVNPPELRQTPFGRFRDVVHESSYSQYPEDQVSVIESGLAGTNLSMPATDLRRLGGFNEQFAAASDEDQELGIRARAAGIRVLYHPQLVALHNDWADTLERFCERNRIYSKSGVFYWQLHGPACPPGRTRLVLENAPIDWKRDTRSLVLKKLLKSVLATPPGPWLVRLGCGLAERFAPESALCWRAYHLRVGLAIFQGVREGWRCYVVSSTAPLTASTSPKEGSPAAAESGSRAESS